MWAELSQTKVSIQCYQGRGPETRGIGRAVCNRGLGQPAHTEGSIPIITLVPWPSPRVLLMGWPHWYSRALSHDWHYWILSQLRHLRGLVCLNQPSERAWVMLPCSKASVGDDFHQSSTKCQYHSTKHFFLDACLLMIVTNCGFFS